MLNNNIIKSIGTFAVSALILFFFTNATVLQTETLPYSINPKKFKIIWHVGVNYEGLSDIKSEALPVLMNFQKMVDGYQFISESNGLNSYWKERPDYCRLNFGWLKKQNEASNTVNTFIFDGDTYVAAHEDECKAKMERDYSDLWKAGGQKGKLSEFSAQERLKAFDRALNNLKILDEKAVGKIVILPLYLTAGAEQDFVYTPQTTTAAEKLSFRSVDGQTQLPSGFKFLLDRGIIPNRILALQEKWQYDQGDQEGGRLLLIPQTPGGSMLYDPNELSSSRYLLPSNLRMLDLLAGTFREAKVPVPKFSVNIRAWSSMSQMLIERYEQEQSINFAGVTFEGGEKSYDLTAARNMEGIAWLLKNAPSRSVTLQIPPFVDSQDLNSFESRDVKLVTNLTDYVMNMNKGIQKAMGLPEGVNPICTSKFNIVITSYGYPIKPEIFPITRKDANGNFIRYAGTISGQITALNQLRNRLCPSAAN